MFSASQRWELDLATQRSPRTRFVFDIDFTVGDVHDLGITHYGHREQIDVTGGTVSGERLDAQLLGRGSTINLRWKYSPLQGSEGVSRVVRWPRTF